MIILYEAFYFYSKFIIFNNMLIFLCFLFEILECRKKYKTNSEKFKRNGQRIGINNTGDNGR